jgi:hypothetical protein
MKIFKSPQKVLILFLSVLIVISFFMIVRLESKAASLQTQWEKHKKSLEKNEDVLDKLNTFSRFVKHNILKMDPNDIMLISGKTWFNLSNDDVFLETNGNLSLGTPTKPYIGFDKSGNVYLRVNTDKSLGYDESKDMMYMLYNDSRILLGKHNFKPPGGSSQGISLRSKSGGPSLSVTDKGIMLDVPHSKGNYRIQMGPHKDNITIRKDESEIKLEKDDIRITTKGDIQIGPSKDKYLGYNSKEDEIQIHQSGSTISFGQVFEGKTLVGTGVKIQGKNNGPRLFVSEKNIRLQIPSQKGSYDITLDPTKGFLGLRCGESYVILEKDNIDIEAKGDININSLNGNVNINGKKVNLNE